jgi:hypothetical protein
MKTLHAITLRKRRTWVSVLSCAMLVTIVASFVAWPDAATVEASSSIITAWFTVMGERWLALVLWSGLALAAFGPTILRSGGVIGALAGEASAGRIEFWTPAMPFRNPRSLFAVDSAHPLKVSLVDHTDMYPGIKYPHVLLESGELARTIKLDGKVPMFHARGIADLARHAGITLEVAENAQALMTEPSPEGMSR